MDFRQATRYLISLGNEVRASASDATAAAKLGLENITILLEDMGRPQDAYPSALIAGTNGKGSTAAMLESILRAARVSTGLYISPHLVEITERIQIDGTPIPESDFTDLFNELRARIERLLAAGKLRFHPTYFECLTAMAMEYFRRRRREFVVFEVGLGGRLDATNTVSQRLSVITQIDFDHERFLGNTIEAIAGEKAGIIKDAAPVIANAAHPEAARVIRARAAEMRAPLTEVWREYVAEDAVSNEGLYSFTARSGCWSLPVKLALRGRHQVDNALSAIAAARGLAQLGFPISERHIGGGLAAARWPGRLELICERPRIFLDGAHNPAGARALARFLDEELSSRRVILVYGAMRDKAVGEITEILFPKTAAVILTQPAQDRAAAPETIRELSGYLNPNVVIEPAPAAALARAMEMARAEDVILVTGSLYLIGDIKKHWAAREVAAADPNARPGEATALRPRNA